MVSLETVFSTGLTAVGNYIK